MPYHINLGKPPIGVSMTAGNKGDKVSISHSEFLSFEDGHSLVSRLEQFSNIILPHIKDSKIKPSIIDHLIAIIKIKKDGTCTVYINECDIIGETRLRRNVKKGEKLFDSDIVDFENLKIKDVTVTKNEGFVFIFSFGWRKALYYDLGPMLPNPIIHYGNYLDRYITI